MPNRDTRSISCTGHARIRREADRGPGSLRHANESRLSVSLIVRSDRSDQSYSYKYDRTYLRSCWLVCGLGASVSPHAESYKLSNIASHGQSTETSQHFLIRAMARCDARGAVLSLLSLSMGSLNDALGACGVWRSSRAVPTMAKTTRSTVVRRGARVCAL